MVLLGAGVPAPASASADGPGGARKVLVLGDSISAAYGIQRETGWVALLQQRLRALNPAHQVVNASVSGETTGGGRARLAAALERHTPDIVVIELGGNDALRGYPVERIRENLEAMVSETRAAGATPVILGMQIPPNYGPRYTSAFQAMFREVADAHEAAYVPFLLDGVATDRTLMQADGIHPTEQAQQLILDNAWAAIATLL